MAKKKGVGPVTDDVVVTFTIGRWTLNEAVELAIQNAIDAHVQDALGKAVKDAVYDLVSKAGEKRVREEIDRAIAEGWPKTNDYGERVGPALTIKERIGQMLTSRDQYSGRGTWVEESMKRKVEEALNKDLKADIEAARNKFKTEVDAVLTATIRDALAKNLGLKA